VPLPNKEVQLV